LLLNFNNISDDLSKISDSLNKADLGKIKNLNETLAKVDGIMKGLKSGNVGKLLNDDALYIK
jgi:phospholipid/cholesterol/gamma-HCH transport system substrate-binding protein